MNDSRSWARHVLAYLPAREPGIAQRQREMIHRHLAFVYALRSALRRSPDRTYEQYLSADEAVKVARFANVPNAILDEQSRALQVLVEEGYVDGFRFNDFNELLIRHCDNMGRSERINNTVFPATYIYFTRLCIWLFVVLTTLAIADVAHGWSILSGTVLDFVYYSTHVNGLSLMNPFEPQPTGVPLDSISRTIEINPLQALGETQIPAPVQPVNGEYIL